MMWGVPDALLGGPEEFRVSRRSRVSAKFHLVKTTGKLYPSMRALCFGCARVEVGFSLDHK